LAAGSDYFRVVGASAISGRDFNDGDQMAPLPVANEAPATIVGVMPEGFVLVYEQSLWMPLAQTPALEGSVLGDCGMAQPWKGLARSSTRSKDRHPRKALPHR
jgi:hypothetical protein